MIGCWFCQKQGGESKDGLCLPCHQKSDDIEVPLKYEEFQRLISLHRLITSAVYGAIKIAETEANDE